MFKNSNNPDLWYFIFVYSLKDCLFLDCQQIIVLFIFQTVLTHNILSMGYSLSKGDTEAEVIFR